MKTSFLLAILVLNSAAGAAEGVRETRPLEFKAGAASIIITPARPLPMAGYSSRKESAEGTEQELYGKALVIEDQSGKRILIITLDLIGVTTELRDAVAQGVATRLQIPSEALLMNASHTHCGPDYSKPEAAEYRESLKTSLVDLAAEAVQNLAPANLIFSHARCGFAMNRRTPTATGFRNHPNPDGQVDHTVPVLSVRNEKGELRATLFGYACHNTTMGFRKWLGDYAGYAQADVQTDHPGATALFLMGCGGDQNPYPRSELKYAQQHGRTLATAVEAALEVNQKSPLHQHTLHGPLRFALETVNLKFADPGRPDLPYPVQILQFGNDLMIVALGTEVVIDYDLRLKAELSREDGPAVWIAGYSNLIDGYIPSRRVLLEGGYEAESRPWDPSLEERIIGKVHDLVDRIQKSPENRTAEP